MGPPVSPTLTDTYLLIGLVSFILGLCLGFWLAVKG